MPLERRIAELRVDGAQRRVIVVGREHLGISARHDAHARVVEHRRRAAASFEDRAIMIWIPSAGAGDAARPWSTIVGDAIDGERMQIAIGRVEDVDHGAERRVAFGEDRDRCGRDDGRERGTAAMRRRRDAGVVDVDDVLAGDRERRLRDDDLECIGRDGLVPLRARELGDRRRVDLHFGRRLAARACEHEGDRPPRCPSRDARHPRQRTKSRFATSSYRRPALRCSCRSTRTVGRRQRGRRGGA